MTEKKKLPCVYYARSNTKPHLVEIDEAYASELMQRYYWTELGRPDGVNYNLVIVHFFL